MPHDYCVYILASRSRTLYVGVTNDLARRLSQHHTDSRPHFTRRYNVDRLVHLETFENVRVALAREKQLKGWSRRKKIALIDCHNPEWTDHSASVLLRSSRA